MSATDNRASVHQLHKEGKSQREIAARLGLSRTGVQHHLDIGTKKRRGYMDLAREVEQRTRTARRLYSQGVPKLDIAAKLGVPLSAVTGYTHGMEAPKSTPELVPNRETPCSIYPQPELWFAMESDSLTTAAKNAATEEAKAICATCPVLVRDACLKYAIETRQPAGVWGGLTQAERKSLLRKKQRRAA
jgi:predicted transcriptional regulator